MAVHRIIEQRAAAQGDATAILDEGVSLSYRELNQRANAVARHLIANGFRRGALATVRLPRSTETAIVLLGILKAGGTYALVDDEQERSAAWPRGVAFAQKAEGDETRFLAIYVASALEHPPQSNANLPILARGSDVACVLSDPDGAPLVLVPHETITALQHHPVSRFARWTGAPGALDLWMALMTGATVTLGSQALQSAAA
jgi:acyl-CoA synthetase (AMP-forming)/AMP-acid ligase II